MVSAVLLGSCELASSRAMHLSMGCMEIVQEEGCLLLEGEEKSQINALITGALR